MFKKFAPPLRRRRAGSQQVLESLESRLLLTINWVNQATSGLAGAPEAAVVEAIDDWEEAIPSYGAGGNNFSLTIFAAQLPNGVLTEMSSTLEVNGVPTAATILIDDDAGGNGFWYFDQTPEDDGEFSTFADTYRGQATSGVPSLYDDLYSAVLHEVGHAIGFSETYSQFAARLDGRTFEDQSGNPMAELTNDTLDTSLDPSASGQDNLLMNTDRPTGTRTVISELELAMFEEAYGFDVADSAPNTFHTIHDETNLEITIRGTDGADTIDIDATIGSVTATVNGFTETVPLPQYVFWNTEVFAEDGNDVITIHDSNYTPAQAGVSATTIDAGAGNDTVNSSSALFGFTILGQEGNDTLNGASGSDDILGGPGRDSINGGRGNDTLLGNNDQDTIIGGDGRDNIVGGNGNDSVLGGSHDDTIVGGSGKDTLKGGSGHDFINAGAHDDFVQAGSGNDEIHGGSGNDTLNGSNNQDTIYGDAGQDELQGGNGHDVLFGGSASSDSEIDYLFGGAGFDAAGLFDADDVPFYDSIEGGIM